MAGCEPPEATVHREGHNVNRLRNNSIHDSVLLQCISSMTQKLGYVAVVVRDYDEAISY